MAHFEIDVADVEASKAFYGWLFDRSFKPMAGGEDFCYHLIEGDGVGGDATPDAGGPIRGAALTFAVADCDATYGWALSHGRAEALPPMDGPRIERCASVEDGQRNVVGMITPEGGT